MNYIFDLYGTLVDIKTDESKRAPWLALCEKLGTPKIFYKRLKREYTSLCKARQRGEYHEIELRDVFSDILTRRHKSADEADNLALCFREASTEKLRLFDGVAQMLSELKEAGHGIYLVSNAQGCFTHREIEICGLTPFFDGIILSSDVGVKKPSPDIFHIAFERFALSPDECIYVGNDMHDDILGATRVGIKSVYIHTEQSGSYKDETLPPPTYTVKNHTELKELLLSI